MFNLNSILGLFLTILAIFGADREADVAHRRSWALITSVEIASTGGADAGGWQLRVSGTFADDCNLALHSEINYFPNNIDVQLYRDIPSNAVCGERERLIEVELTLADAGDASYVAINDQVWKIDIASSSESGASDAPGLLALSLFPVWVDEAVFTYDDKANQILLAYRGQQAVGCDLAEIYSLRATSAGLRLGVYNAMAADTVCAAHVMPIDEIIELPATFPRADALFFVNTFQIEALEEHMVSDSDKVLTNIFRVEVRVMESMPPRISLEVEGEHPDGCKYPVLVEQRRRGDTVDIEVFRVVPADVVCPMILIPYRDTISLDGAFEPGEYTINVNSLSQAVRI